MAHDVFISYSSKDTEQGAAVCAALERAGISCWMAPRDIVPGVGWAKSIIQAINGARAMVLIVSSQSNDSPQVEREVERAVNKSIPIVPFRIEKVPLGDALEYFLSSPHWLEAYNPPLEPHLEQLTEAVRILLGTAAARRKAATPRVPAEQPPKTEIVKPVEPRINAEAERAPQKTVDPPPKIKTEPMPPVAERAARRAIFLGMASKQQKAMVAGALASAAAVLLIVAAGVFAFVEALKP